jgi:hypothetical protein
MSWSPATVDQVRAIVAKQLGSGSNELRTLYSRFTIDPYSTPIIRYGKVESVVVVARNGGEVVYWEDVEEGFNLSPIDNNGLIVEHSCNQDDLGIALRPWL